MDIYSLCVHGRIPIHEEIVELDYEMGDRSFLHHDIGTNPNGMPVQVLVGFVNVNQLTRLADRYSNNELFEKNVRLFLGTGREVNRQIIETITSNQSPWFGFMNNGVSITAEHVAVDLPPSKKKVKVRLKGMQIINGCQTVNALYHAKYDAKRRDRFQGNSSVMVRIYQVEAANSKFLDALIRATNSQNAIRPEDLLSNDNIQRTLQEIYRGYSIAYERKEGEATSWHGSLMTFTKEQAAMAYLGVFMGQASRIRNSLSRREFFREGQQYYETFNLRDPDGQEEVGALPDDFVVGEAANRRALQILAARCMEEEIRKHVMALADKQLRASLRKGAFYLARISYLRRLSAIDTAIAKASRGERHAEVARSLIQAVTEAASGQFDDAVRVFTENLKEHLSKHGGNEDVALKNSEFAGQVDQTAKRPSAPR